MITTPTTNAQLEAEVATMRRRLELLREKEKLERELSERELNDTDPGTWDNLVAVVADEFQVTITAILSRSRIEHVSHARQVVMFLIREHFRSVSLSKIGKHFKRDHGTVLHACQAVKNRMDVDPKFRAQVALVEKILLSRLADRQACVVNELSGGGADAKM